MLYCRLSMGVLILAIAEDKKRNTACGMDCNLNLETVPQSNIIYDIREV